MQKHSKKGKIRGARQNSVECGTEQISTGTFTIIDTAKMLKKTLALINHNTKTESWFAESVMKVNGSLLPDPLKFFVPDQALRFCYSKKLS